MTRPWDPTCFGFGHVYGQKLYIQKLLEVGRLLIEYGEAFEDVV